jgi:uncharacterized protein
MQAAEPAPAKLKVLIVDGQNNHQWQVTTPLLKQILEQSQRFDVTVATSPAKGQDMKEFRPKFAEYDVVLSNYNGEPWPKETEQDLVNYVKSGKGLSIIHAANNSFPKWAEYNAMIAVGGWGGRNEKSGPYLRYRDGQVVRDPQPGAGGHHGPQHEFTVVVRNAEHPITKGMPSSWLHTKDELYDRLRGPAENVDLLATAYSDPMKNGTGEHEPMIFTVKYGEGRVFHTPMGHAAEAMQCVGFAATVSRGTEWAATGKVTIPIPATFPSAEKTTTWEPKK